MTINKDMTIAEVLGICPDIAPVFQQFGMHCLGCPISRGETVLPPRTESTLKKC